MLTAVTFTAPAIWASALINGDWSGLEESDAFELRQYLKANPEHGNAAMCSEETHIGHFSFWCSGSLMCELLEYTFLAMEG